MTRSAFSLPLAAAILSGVFLGALTACGDGSDTASGETATPDPTQMASAVVQSVTIEQPIIGTGTIAPLQSTDLGPRVDGIIEEIYVRVGQRVEKDEPLFRTRDIDLKFKEQELENELKLASATATEASRDYNRIAKLHKRGNASAGALDKSRAAHESAQARLGIAEAKLGQARQALVDAVVTAPYAGVITARNVHEGHFMATRMGGGGMMGPSGVVQIMEIHIVAAIVQVPEVHLSKFAVGTRAKVIVDGLNDEFESEVHRINDFIDPVKRTIEVRIGIENEDYRIKPGSFARALIYPPAQTVLALPRGTVLGYDEQQYVFVEQNGVAQRRSVETTQLDAERVTILSGLEEGDTVLSGPGLRTLVDGDPVIIRDASEADTLAASDIPA
ncbi:efflux RND transporter periplasmic adaptor subunit [Pyruvatibacter sp.]|uniref:efflux RND transporter periplasmic adaptor subunit n=1 Tax=Pyruvatibacter sp. TaxID=1981328 RepID=UPI0032EE48FE